MILRRINVTVHGKRGITADAEIRLARNFDTSGNFLMYLLAVELQAEMRTPDAA